ncbi:MAG: hypothetical protein IJY43_02920 [Clostridia bacterium]|nr:hypothetical protein [Clostridia bacterium]
MERNEERNGRVQLEFTDKTQPVEHTAEIALPDYRSEISRLLWVRPIFMPPTHFIGGGKADFSGPVRYNILYTGPDGALYSADSEEDYAFSVPLESLADFDMSEGIALSAELCPDAVISRVTGPRKLSVRCRMRVRVKGYAVKNLTPHLKGDDEKEDDVRRLCDMAESGRVLIGESERFELSDQFEPDAGEGELRLICANGSVFLPDVTASSDTVRCRGEAVISVMLCRESSSKEQGVPFTAVRRIPFEQEVDVKGITPECDARAMGTVGGVDVTVEDGRVQLNAQLSLHAEGQTEEGVLLCRDVFLPGSRVECQMREEKLWRAGSCGNRNFSVSGERSLAELGVPSDINVLYSFADAEVKEHHTKGERAALSGEMHCHVLYSREGEYGVAELTVPFSTALEKDEDDISVQCCVPVCRVSISRDALRADAEIQLALRCSKSSPVKILSEATFVTSQPMPRADLEICYPTEDDTLWNVGKRYGVSPDVLAAANGLSAEAPGEADSLQGVRYLLIP